MRNKLRRPLAFLLSAVMIVTMSGTPVHAVADRGQPETGLCEHHTAHTDDCGYTEETPGTPCGHEHTEDCYIEVTECVHEHTPECYPEETEDSVSDNEATPANAEEREPENCPHICDGESGCITEKLDCRHEHDSECGYTESTPGTPCTYVCEICNPQDSGEADEEPETGIIKQEHCSCLTLCTEGQINPDCLVCGAENADLSDCKGKAEKEDTKQPEDTGICKHHQEHDDACGYQPESEDSEGSPCTYECRICPIEDLIAALPDKVTEDNADNVRGQLDEILALFSVLTEDEQEQIDLSRCYELQGALDGANDPAPITESVEYQEASWDGSQVTYESKTETCTLVENSAEAVTWTAGWYAVSGTVTISEPITVTGAVNLILTNGCTLTAEKGIVATSTNSLTIYAQSENGGTLNATGTTDDSGNASAGIGGSETAPDSGTITIHGGVINATGGGQSGRYGGAGIGGGTSRSGNGGNSGTIIIYGNTVTANSGEGSLTGAGIGGGGGLMGGGAGNNIQIYGGTINATGSEGSAGIGGGGSNTIDDSSHKSGDGAVTISGGTVTAVGGNYAAGIGGGGYYYSSQYSSGGCTGGTGSVTISGGIVDASSPTDVYWTGYAGAPIGNGGNTTAAATVSKTNAIVFENGAGTVCGDVTLNGSYTVPGDYTLNIPVGASLSGSGTLSGGNAFTTENLTEDMISVPTNLYYDGKDRTEYLTTELSGELDKGITICGQTFTVSGWTLAVAKTDDLTYTATYTNNNDNTNTFTKTITLQKSGTDLTSEGKVQTYKGDTLTKDFTASDTITVKATPTATGEAPAKAAARLRGNPTAGQMAVFVGDTQVSAPADKGADGAYTMTVSAADVLVAAGGPGTGITLTAKFVGNNNMADAAGTVPVNISAVAKVVNGSSTTFVGALADAFIEGNDGAIITLLSEVDLGANYISIDNTFTLDLNGQTVKATGSGAFNISGGSLTIQDSGTGGKIESSNITVSVIDGTLSIESGTVSGFYGVGIYGGTVNISGGVISGEEMGLWVRNSGKAVLSGGTLIGKSAVSINVDASVTLKNLLAEGYAYHRNNLPVTKAEGWVDSNTWGEVSLDTKALLTGTVTVKKCNHTGEGVCEYTHATGTTTHQQTCLACGRAAATEKCSFDETGACPCGAALAVALPEDLNLIYDGTLQRPAVTVTLDGITTLEKGTDYGVYYLDSVNAGNTAKVTVTGTTFTGTFTLPFTIKPATPTLAWESTTQELTYTGNEAMITAPKATGVNGTQLGITHDTGPCQFSYATQGSSEFTNGLPINAGTYTIKASVAAKGNYAAAESTNTLTLTIRKAAPLTPKTGDLAVANKQEHTYTYGLGALRPDVQEGMSLGSTAVTYELGPVNLGSYYDSGAMIDGQTLTLPIKAVESDSETKIGTITVTIHTQNFEDMTATINVRSVNKQSVDISGVTLTGRTYNGSPIEYQQTATASVDGKTVNVNGFVYTWDTPNHAAPVNAGNYTLTVSVDPEDRNYTGSTTIPVVIEQAEIRVTAPSKTIYVGETAPVFSAADCNITGLVQGENLKTPPTVAYAEAPDTSKTGSVTVTASGAEVPEGGNYKDRIVYENGTLTITSKPLPPAKYTVTVQAGKGGTASASPSSAEKGTKITLNATPDGGYHFKEWQVISGGVTISNNSFTMPAANVTVKAVFERNSNGGGNSGGSGGGGGSSSGGGPSSGDNGSSGGGSTIVARPDETKPDTPTTSQTKPATPDKNGNVAVDNGTVQSAINTAKNDAKKNGNTANGVAVVIPVTPKEGQNSFNVTINAQTLNTLVREKVKRLEINIEGVVVGGMDTKLLKWLDTLSANGDVIFRVKKTDPSGLSKEAKAAIGTRPVYDLSLVYLSGGKETPITDFDGHTIAVRLPYAPAKDEKTGNLYAVYVDGKGKVEWLTKSSYDPDLGTVVFEAGHFSIYGIGYKNPVPVFTDIKNHWAEDNIIFVASRGLLAGTGNNQFSPDTGMTRGMFVTALGRLADIDPNSYKTGKFTDVKADAYYAPYVNWAAEKGIVNGTSATTFSPDTNITREQMAVIMANYAKKLGYDLPAAHEAVTFADNAQISGWAAKEVKAMQQAGIMAGKGGNRFDPKGTATRAEVATVLRRFVEIVIDPQTAQGWMQNHSGSWQYMKNGKPVTGWLQDDKKWYWLDSNG
ncbi:S-layer homology domain-containing protein, partial [Faecalibaculum rodentium]|uniref:S-layer homology domain-containing protein n=2 Tax=Bacillota TaxID=1239 RepID=UPI00273055B6